MNILLTGATGFIGKPLSQTLTNQGHEVYAWVRNLAKAKAQLDNRVKCIEQLDEARKQYIDAVINLAGEPIADKRWSKKRKTALRDSRIGLTYKLVDFIHTLKQKPTIILSGSAIGYYGSQAADVELNEDSDHVSGFTHELCADWEAAAMSLANDSTRVCLLRTGVVLGSGGGALGKMLLPYKLGLGGPIGNGLQMMSWIHLQDWINASLFLLSNEALSGPFNLVSPNPVNNKAFTNALARTVHRPAVLKVPCFLLKLVLGEASMLLCEGQRVIPKKLLDAGYSFKFSHIEQAFADIVTTGK